MKHSVVVYLRWHIYGKNNTAVKSIFILFIVEVVILTPQLSPFILSACPPLFRFPHSSLLFHHSLSQPPLSSTHLPCHPLEVALALPFLPPPLLPPSPTAWRLGRQRWDCCLLSWRTRPGGFTPRRPSFSSASPWVSAACDSDLSFTPKPSPYLRNTCLILKSMSCVFNPFVSH